MLYLCFLILKIYILNMHYVKPKKSTMAKKKAKFEKSEDVSSVVFVYSKNKKFLVFNFADAQKYHEDLIKAKYKHEATIKAEVYIEGLLNGDFKTNEEQ